MLFQHSKKSCPSNIYTVTTRHYRHHSSSSALWPRKHLIHWLSTSLIEHDAPQEQYYKGTHKNSQLCCSSGRPKKFFKKITTITNPFELRRGRTFIAICPCGKCRDNSGGIIVYNDTKKQCVQMSSRRRCKSNEKFPDCLDQTMVRKYSNTLVS